MSTAAVNPGMHRIAGIVNLILAVVIGVVLAQWLVSAISPSTEPAAALLGSHSGANASNRPTPSGNLAASIAAQHLFGNAAAAPQPQAAPTEKAPDTRLRIELVGVVAFDPIEQSMAILKSGANENVYAIGDRVGGTAKLVEVYPDHVIIENGGRREAVRLPENIAQAAPPIARVSANPALPADNQVARRPPPIPAASSASLADLPSEPGALRARLVKEPRLLGQIAQVQPYREDGKVRGYRINPRQGAAVLSSLGLYAGDVVLSINGQSLTNQRQGLNAMRKLVNASEVNLVVLRGGAEVPISVSLR